VSYCNDIDSFSSWFAVENKLTGLEVTLLALKIYRNTLKPTTPLGLAGIKMLVITVHSTVWVLYLL